MPILSCPTCSKALTIPEELLGKKVKCSACLAVFKATRPAEEPAERQEEKPRRRGPDPDSRIAEEDEEEDRPRRRRRVGPRRLRRDYEPHRGGMILGLGITALALTFLGAVGAMIVGVCALPFPVVGLILGIVSWVMGNGDMRAIRTGRIDPDGAGQTQTGRVMGMVTVILNIVGLCLCGGLVIAALLFGLAILGMGAGGGGGQPPFGPPRRR
jgi:hypothetical protein